MFKRRGKRIVGQSGVSLFRAGLSDRIVTHHGY